MVTISELARAWGVSHQYTSKLAKKGMPLDSKESADLWREAYASSKAPSNPLRVARTVDEQNDDGSLVAAKPQKCCFENKPNGAKSPSKGSLEDILLNARRAAHEAWRLLHESIIEGKKSKIQVLLNIHNKAVEAQLRAESAYRDELERRKILIPLSEAQLLVRKVVGVIVSRLNALPQNVAARCNLTDPRTTMTILEEECAVILKDAQQAI